MDPLPRRPADRALAGYLRREFDGGFADYCTVPAVNVHRIERDDITDVELAALACSWSTAAHMLHRVGLEAGQRIAVTGARAASGARSSRWRRCAMPPSSPSPGIEARRDRGATSSPTCGRIRLRQVARRARTRRETRGRCDRRPDRRARSPHVVPQRPRADRSDRLRAHGRSPTSSSWSTPARCGRRSPRHSPTRGSSTPRRCSDARNTSG